MPLGKLTDPEPAFALLGRLKKGAPKGDNGQVGKDLDYWRVTFLKSPDRERIEEQFKRIYGNEPREINIRLAFDSVSENWDANLECYKNGVMIAKCGNTEQRGFYWINYRDPHTGDVLVRDSLPVGDAGVEFTQKPIDPTKPVYTTKSGNDVYLKPLGRLRVVIPEIALMDPPVVGWFEVQLTSTKDIRQISGELKAISNIAKEAGSPLFGIPMRLSRIEEEITKNINGNLTRGPSWMVHIELQGQWATKSLQYVERKALPILDAEVVEDEPELNSDEPWDREIIEPEHESPSVQQNDSQAVPRQGEPECTPQFLVNEKRVDTIKNGKALMDLLGIPAGSPAGASLKRVDLFLAWRKVKGYERNDKESRERAVQKAINGEVPPKSK